MGSPPGLPASSLLQVLFLGLSTFAPASGAQFQLHVPAGLDRVLAVEGDEVVLPAWYTFQGEAAAARPWETLTLMWFLEQEGEDLQQVLAHINGATTSQDGASLVYPMPSRNVSLRLQGLREKGLRVLPLLCELPPAPPSCHLLGTPRVGTNVTLSCKSPRSKPLPCTSGSDAISGFLSLRNLSSSMSGVYICKASNKVGSASCNVTLEVSTGPGAAVVAGAVVGTLVGLGLLAGLVLLYQRQGKVPDEVANDIKEDATAPRTLPWPKGSDTISKNGTLSSVTSSPALRPPHGPSRLGASTPTRSLGWVSPSALSRKGAVPVMVPAQNQAGSLV
ncbi:hypothetical protein QTO34_012084 [Cnephaeus nilssonii]|uniref:Immunoglobulin domain-containing protein n=1 Tax=Cnephaeus nilssonii TaxID=3371016 RepID=A0AA40HC69_CNENI|nr:hypothetical protein QTO34_012084 [Eptesicus nilssonii]